MKLYLAALYTNNFSKDSTAYNKLTDREKKARDDVKHILESYHYVYRQSAVDKMRLDEAAVFLDSGAFSAFTKGVKVDIVAYCDYIKRNQDILERVGLDTCASVLDAIGDVQGTWDNQQRMEQQGVRPLPCFHYGEDERYLEWYVANYEYITIGGMVPISTPQLVLWLDRIWKQYLTKPDGTPKIRVHGFGLTTLSLMTRYPWFSVDSSSWVQMAGNGSIMIPGYGAVSVSVKSPSAKQAGRHVDTVAAPIGQRIIGILDSQGFEIERLRTEYVSRWVYNCWAFCQIGDILNTTKRPDFMGDQIGLFDA